MKYTLVVVFAVVVLGLAACGRDTAAVSAGGKSEGPPVNTLSHEQLMAAYRECTEYGPIDDPKVKYTVQYCAAIQAGHLSEGYTAPGTAKVDPTLNKMH
jgi:hypothetical protein